MKYKQLELFEVEPAPEQTPAPVYIRENIIEGLPLFDESLSTFQPSFLEVN